MKVLVGKIWDIVRHTQSDLERGTGTLVDVAHLTFRLRGQGVGVFDLWCSAVNATQEFKGIVSEDEFRKLSDSRRHEVLSFILVPNWLYRGGYFDLYGIRTKVDGITADEVDAMRHNGFEVVKDDPVTPALVVPSVEHTNGPFGSGVLFRPYLVE